MPRDVQRPPGGEPAGEQGTDLADRHTETTAVVVESWVESWATRIRPHMIKAVEGIVDTGRELAEARETAPHGAWGPLCSELGLHPRTAHRLMQIARHPVIANRTHASDLPAAWSTLYELSRVEPDQLAQAIEDGRVTPELGRGQAKTLADRGYRRQLDTGVIRDRAPLTGRCSGCVICERCICHYTTDRKRTADLFPAVYIDCHQVAYDTYIDAEEIEIEPWQPFDLPGGQTVYVWRREWEHCGLQNCPPCELLERQAPDRIRLADLTDEELVARAIAAREKAEAIEGRLAARAELAVLEGRIQLGLECLLGIDPKLYPDIRHRAEAAGIDPVLIDLLIERIEMGR